MPTVTTADGRYARHAHKSVPTRQLKSKARSTAQLLANLDQKGKLIAEYVWMGGTETTGCLDIRSKARTLDARPASVADLPLWNYDGSSTGQAPGKDSEVLLKPVAIFDDPFRGGDNILVLCEALTPATMKPIPTNKRAVAKAIFDQKLEAKPMFGIKQEYTLYELDKERPLGWPAGGFPAPQGRYYCSLGTDVSFGRNVMDDHYKACLYAGVNIAGSNAEIMPGQWEYQIGPCTGIDSGDHLWMSRYLMVRVCEALGVNVTFDPKPIAGDWHGAACHTNYSTEKMRCAMGHSEVVKAIYRLKLRHAEHIGLYGDGNERRLTGARGSSLVTNFSYGVANRNVSVRIPTTLEEKNCRLEDRRPAANSDPYVVTSKIFKTTELDA